MIMMWGWVVCIFFGYCEGLGQEVGSGGALLCWYPIYLLQPSHGEDGVSVTLVRLPL